MTAAAHSHAATAAQEDETRKAHARYTADRLPQAELYTHEALTTNAARARARARTTKGPGARQQYRNEARTYHAELARRTDEHASAAQQTLNRYGKAGAAQIAHAILATLNTPTP